jgi:peptidoglycan/LPS O-acetylase OafA/YrhL
MDGEADPGVCPSGAARQPSTIASSASSGGSGETYYIAPLTAMRGIAALLVVLFHAPMFGFAPHFVQISSLPVKGYIWVDFFFMLSGFILCHVHGASFADRVRGIDVADYLVARFARIYPLHLAVLLALAVVILASPYVFGEASPATTGAVSHELSFRSFLASLALVQSWPFGGLPTWNAPAWSISCEVAVYVAFPFLALALAKGGKIVVCLLVLLWSLILAATWWKTVPHSISSDYWLLRCAGEFTIGACIYVVYAASSIPRVLAGDPTGWIIIAALVVGLQFGLPDIALLPLLALLLIVCAVNRGQLAATLNRPLPQFLGRISYSIYLVHYPLLILLALTAERLWGRGILIHQGPVVRSVLFLLVLPLVLGVASLAHRHCELPCRTRLVTWWRNRRRGVTLPRRALTSVLGGIVTGFRD